MAYDINAIQTLIDSLMVVEQPTVDECPFSEIKALYPDYSEKRLSRYLNLLVKKNLLTTRKLNSTRYYKLVTS